MGFHTLYSDLYGLILFVCRTLFPKKTLKAVTICTGIYNRSDNYLNQLLASLNKANHQDLIELSVYDCASNDVSNLEVEIRKRWKGKLIFNSKQEKFTRSHTFNQAVNQATSELIFICDADLSIPSNIVVRCNNFVGKGIVWYPIYFFLYKNRPAIVSQENGEWEQYGSRGMLSCLKQDYQKIGGLNEKYQVWGGEDTDLWERFHRAGFIVIRNREHSFFHHWHQTHNKKFMHMND